MSTVQHWIDWARVQLSMQVVTPPDTVVLEAHTLLGHVLGLSRASLLSRANDEVGENHANEFQKLISRRVQHEPIAYILGEKEFYSLPFIVTPDVLIPRPETESLVERAIEILSTEQAREICKAGRAAFVDVGVGSGAILLSTLHALLSKFPKSEIPKALGVDVSNAALNVAKLNADQLGLSDSVEFICSNLLEDLSLHDTEELLFVANLPYVPNVEVLPPDVHIYEPKLALRAGPDGLDIILRFLKQLSQFSGVRFRALLEVGEGQVRALQSPPHFFLPFHWRAWKDLAGVERFLELSNKSEL